MMESKRIQRYELTEEEVRLALALYLDGHGHTLRLDSAVHVKVDINCLTKGAVVEVEVE